MAYGVLSAGFSARPQTDIEDEARTAILEAISPNLDLGSTSLLGQFLGVHSAQLRQIWEVMQDIYSSRSPSQALDDALDMIGELSLTPRLQAAPSVAYMTITLDAGTYLAGTLRVNVAGDTSKVFTNDSEITVASTQTLTNQVFSCTVDGPTVANAGTLTAITSPVTGFSAPTNPTAASLGRDREPNADYRARRTATLSRQGSASVDGIRADLLDVDGVTYASVLENPTASTDAYGIPAWSIWAVVEGGLAADIASTILSSKAGGIATYGGTSEVVYDASGNAHTIKFDTPTEVPCEMVITYSWLSGSYLSEADADDAVKAAVLEAADTLQGVGRDVVLARYVAALMSLGTLTDVSLTADTVAGGTPVAANVVLDPFERATFVVGNLSTVPTEVGAEP